MHAVVSREWCLEKFRPLTQGIHYSLGTQIWFIDKMAKEISSVAKS
jgi:hypothetical protein